MPPRPERLALAPAVLLAGLYVARVLRTGDEEYGFLLWNVFLAAMPAALAILADRLNAARAPRSTVLVLLLWLLFLPNAPYVLTDFMHLRPHPPVPLWYDVALLGTASLAGLALGAASLARVHALVGEALGARVALAAVFLASLASGYGIYLGRFARLNSWDALLDPLAVLEGAVPPFVDPALHWRAWAVTLVFGAVTAASYLAHAGMRPERSLREPFAEP